MHFFSPANIHENWSKSYGRPEPHGDSRNRHGRVQTYRKDRCGAGVCDGFIGNPHVARLSPRSGVRRTGGSFAEQLTGSGASAWPWASRRWRHGRTRYQCGLPQKTARRGGVKRPACRPCRTNSSKWDVRAQDRQGHLSLRTRLAHSSPIPRWKRSSLPKRALGIERRAIGDQEINRPAACCHW